VSRKVRARRMNVDRRGGFVGLEVQVRVVFARPDSRQLRGHGDWMGRFRGKHGPIEVPGITFSLSTFSSRFLSPDLSPLLEYYSPRCNEHV